MKAIKLLTTLFLVNSLLFAENYDVFSIGHSLVNFNMPRIFAGIANSDPIVTHRHEEQVINGANLKWNWNNGSQQNAGTNAREALPTGDYEILVMTEAVPLINHIEWSEPWLYGGNFYDLAITANPAAQVYLYETWHCINSGTPEGCDWDDKDTILWRDRLTQDLPLWQSIVDSINNRFPDRKPMLLVPAGQAMAALYDSIEVGAVPGIVDIAQLYSDNIHPNDLGNYFVACVMYATIYKRSPEGLARETFNEWGNPYEAPSEELAAVMQKIAWEVVSTTPGTGVDSDPTSKQHLQNYSRGNTLSLSVFDRKLKVTSNYRGPIHIADFRGRVVKRFNLESDNQIIDLPELAKGVYFLKAGIQTGISAAAFTLR